MNQQRQQEGERHQVRGERLMNRWSQGTGEGDETDQPQRNRQEGRETDRPDIWLSNYLLLFNAFKEWSSFGHVIRSDNHQKKLGNIQSTINTPVESTENKQEKY